VERRAPPLETNTRPPLQLNIVKRPTRTVAGQDQHNDSYQLMPDTGNRGGVPRAGRDAGRLSQDVVVAVGDLAQLGD
jgi:hypothetical protein